MSAFAPLLRAKRTVSLRGLAALIYDEYTPYRAGKSAGEENLNEISETSQRSPAGASPVWSKP
jgi:hypothetical protein